MDNCDKEKRRLLKSIGAATLTGGISTSGLWLPETLLASTSDEFLEYKRQMQQGSREQLTEFAQFKKELESEFKAFIEHGTLKYEKKHNAVLSKTRPSAEDIRRNGNDKEKAEVELDILHDTVTDEYEHGEKDRLIAEAAKALMKKKPKGEKTIRQLEKDFQQAEKPAKPLLRSPARDGSLISVLHQHDPKPFIYPFSRGYRLSSYFGIRNLRHNGKKLKKHCGIDIAAPRGTPILAMTDGVVKMKFNHKFGGKSIIIEATQPHQGKRIRFSTCHMQKFNSALREGSRVIKGKTIIGYVGSTGRSTGPHIHLTNYEFSDSSRKWLKVNPLKYTAGCVLPGDYKNNRYQFETCTQISRKI